MELKSRNSVKVCWVSATISSGIGLTVRLAISSFQMPKSCSKTMVLPSPLIPGKRTSPEVKWVICSGCEPSWTRQMLV